MDLPHLLEVLTLEAIGPDAFVGRSPEERTRPVYGGQFLAQALLAAARTVGPDRVPHSLHAYFVRSGASRTPIEYRVERIRDGRSFSHRSVVATQEGREVFRQMLSFQVPTPGLEYSQPVDGSFPVDPGTMPGYRDWVEELSNNRDHQWFAERLPLDIRFEDAPPPRPRPSLAGPLRIWMRLLGEVPSDDASLHAALLAWMSDKTISDVTLYPHGRTWTDSDHDVLSLDHVMYFHEPSRADAWTLFTHEAPATRGGRGLARGDLISLDGRRIGALAQEALLVTPPPSAL